jgi:hypothetical protein
MWRKSNIRPVLDSGLAFMGALGSSRQLLIVLLCDYRKKRQTLPSQRTMFGLDVRFPTCVSPPRRETFHNFL